MSGKILILSLVISILIVASINSGLLENNDITGSTSTANLDINSFSGDVVYFAIGNIIILIILTGVVYLFMRGICKSFGRM